MYFREMHFITILQLLLLMFIKRVDSSILLAENLTNLHENSPNISDLETSKSTKILEGKCLRVQCKYTCYKGTHATIQPNVNDVDDKECPLISELYLINYQFPHKILPTKFLGPISDKVIRLYISSCDIEHIDVGAFASRTLTGVHLEKLKLKFIDKQIFRNVSEQFTSFTLIQSNPDLTSVTKSFLKHIKYQIKSLTIQTGLMEIENLTNSQILLNSLGNIDLSYNNFGGMLTSGSFDQLSVVEKLNLTHSAITFLPEKIFFNIVNTLKMLDLSNNKLTVISQNIFGWRSINKGMTLYLHLNPWECSCDLQKEISYMAGFQGENVYCRNMENVLVTSEQLCPMLSTTSTPIQTSSSNRLPKQSSSIFPTHSSQTDTFGYNGGASNSRKTFTEVVETTNTEAIQTTEILPPPTASELNAYVTTDELECHKDNGKMETENLSIYWPNTQFDIVKKKMLEVDIVVRTNLNQTYGVLWFSKVTRQYYKMETNHNEYGLGCYGRVERVTTVNHLLPDMSYTFCLILKDYLTVSPFSCKSVYISSNLDVNYNAWLTTSMKATGISVMIIGAVLLMFLGILFVFIVLKHKPSLLKGSKRVAMQKSDASNIIVFPEDKTLKKFKLMEEQLANNKLGGFPFKRLSSASTNSLDSIQSYMNPENLNLYEVIPAHQSNLNGRYAEVPFKRKRSSNDPLPKIPHKVEENTSPSFERKLEVPVNQSYETEVSVYI